ncbi:MAG: VWA domain-containing protein [Azospirillaceae bacterium]
MTANAGRGQLAANIMHFCRTLRAAGLPVGPGQTLAAIAAVESVGIGSRQDFYWTLHATLVNRRDQREIFDQAFHMFWRNPDILKRAMAMLLPQVDAEAGSAQRGEPVRRRVAEAFGQGTAERRRERETEIELDARLTFSDREKLSHKDFEQMTAAEIAEARQAIARLRLPVPDAPTRRFDPATAGRPDPRRTLRRSLRQGGMIDLAFRRRRRRPPPLVVICDISGSMSQYSRMLLHFLHAITSDRDRVHSFVFGTRLTNITRTLRHRDVDEALARVGESVADWSGGTRIGWCLRIFNRDWSRRVLGQGATVLLITDGLDRDAGAAMEPEVERLAMSCRRLIWLNPLLRFDRYAPKSKGARILVRHATELRSAHNLASLRDIVDALGDSAGGTSTRMASWRALAA